MYLLYFSIIDFLPHTSSCAFKMLSWNDFPKFGASISISSPTFCSKLLCLSLSVYFHILLIILFFVLLLFNFFYVCNYKCMLQISWYSFIMFKYFLSFLPTNTKSISVPFPPDLYVIFLFSFFLNQVFARHSFLSQNSSNISPSTFFSPKPFPPCILSNLYIYTYQSTYKSIFQHVH